MRVFLFGLFLWRICLMNPQTAFVQLVLLVFGIIGFISFLSILWCFLNLEDNSGYMNSGYGNVRYTVYIWGFSCLDYSFNVLILRINNLGLYNWFCHIYFTYCLIVCYSMLVLTTRFSMHAFWLGFIDTCVLIYAHLLAFFLPLVGEFWLPWSLHVQILELALWWTSWWSELRNGSIVDQSLTVRSFILPSPLLVLRVFFFVTHERLLYYSYLCISLYSRICAYRWCNIFIILYHIMW